jgi:AAA domain, putative AbiEii toxin, Type IV TA system
VLILMVAAPSLRGCILARQKVGEKVEIVKIKTDRINVEFLGVGHWGGNRVDLITGPNGSGKTEALTVLVDLFRGARPHGENDVVTWRSGQRTQEASTLRPNHVGPTRVIAQTFSPFNRFAEPAALDISMTSIYSEGVSNDARYVCVGLHRSTRLVGAGISKRTLEQAIYRLSEAPETIEDLFAVMKSLNLEEGMELIYEARPTLRRLLKANSLELGIKTLLSELANKSPLRVAPRTGLSAEVRRVDPQHLAALLGEALHVLGSKLRDRPVFSQRISSKFRVASEDFLILQSLALLRRFDLLALKSCELTTRAGIRFDVANASSGQQQMLCSVIGLATALRRESLVLIDEPELSLHPRWQQAYLEYVKAAMRPFEGCHVLIATHSPLIVQRGQTLGAGIIQVGDDQHIGTPNSTSNSVEGTLLNIFDTPLTASTYLANQIFSAITDAEDGTGADRQQSIADLERLKHIYSDHQVGDPKSLMLIKEAIELLNMDEDADA